MEDSQLWEEEEEPFDTLLLTELLEEQQQHHGKEEATAAGGDDGRLRSVIWSLEGEISADGDGAMLLHSAHRHQDCEDCRMDDILAGVSSRRRGCSISAAMAAHAEDLEEKPFGWVEIAAAAEESACGGDMADWYVDECIDELMAANCGELRGQYCAASGDERFCSLRDL